MTFRYTSAKAILVYLLVTESNKFVFIILFRGHATTGTTD